MQSIPKNILDIGPIAYSYCKTIIIIIESPATCPRQCCLQCRRNVGSFKMIITLNPVLVESSFKNLF